ncbi:MAG: ABC transporter permease subunit [Rhodospirillaceae bacterium]|jgi:His/Glu/Gln/Arg/opine family amino acid ABC transporter permease subunit|nr:ABC transporter permease subunit [Rhodospirillaceae bacterium]
MEATIGWWDDFFWAGVEVVQVFFVALAGTVAFGLMGAAAKLSNSRIAQKIANAYTIVFRGTPEILILLLIYFGSAITLTAIVNIFDPTVKFVDIPPFWAGSFGISLIVGGYATETFRGAFLGVDPGQIEAARALGISTVKTFFYVRVPAMWRLALPPFGNHMLSVIKDTALISVIGLNELLFVAEQGMAATAEPFPFFIAVGAIYLGFSTIITLTTMALEKHANKHLERVR